MVHERKLGLLCCAFQLRPVTTNSVKPEHFGEMKKLKKKDYLEKQRRHRLAHELDRRARRKARKRQGFKVPPQLPSSHYKREHAVMAFLRSRFRGKNLARYDLASGRWILGIPKIFSLISNPEETLDTINSIVTISHNKQIKSLFLDYSVCEDIDLGASAILDMVVSYLRDEWVTLPGRSILAGVLPNDERLNKILLCTGITKSLSIKGMEPPRHMEEELVRFPLFKGRRKSGSQLVGRQDRDEAASQMVSYVDGCLAKGAGYKLSDDGKRQILKWAGELITNAEEHSGHDEWYAIGYMAPLGAVATQKSDFPIGECRFTVFGFGKSIYESLSGIGTSETKDQISKLVAVHTRKGWFGRKERFSPQDLWTLYALQDGVSRFNLIPGGQSRGKGTVEMIEAFQELGKTLDDRGKPEMVLISGSTRIYFDEIFHLRERGDRMIIAFNDNNDLEEKPDSDHVHSLTGYFPGTVLSMRFFIDKRYLDKHQPGTTKGRV